jgi:hypothetical protein
VGKIVLGGRDPRGHSDLVFSNNPRLIGRVALWREGGCIKCGIKVSTELTSVNKGVN